MKYFLLSPILCPLSSWHEPVSSGVTSRAESPGSTAAPYPQVRVSGNLRLLLSPSLDLSSPYPQVRALGNVSSYSHLFKNQLINIDLIQAGMYSSCKMQGPPSPQEPKVLRIFLETFFKTLSKILEASFILLWHR